MPDKEGTDQDFGFPHLRRASLVAWTVKRLPTMRETRIRSLGREDPLKKEEPKSARLQQRRSGQEELLHVQGQDGGEEISFVHGKEQRLRFAGATVKRYPMSKVRETQKTVGVARGHQRADTLKPYSQKTSQSNHTEHSLI